MHKKLHISPGFKALIPPLTPEEYIQLEQNILAQGCRDPIVLWRGTIVDGHNRYEICTKHGIEYKTVKLRLPSRDAAKIWILENQLGRRNLTDAMRIELAARKVGYMGHTTYVNKHIAREAKLSEKTVQRYMQIKGVGDQELLAKVMSGEYKIGTAHKQVEVITTTVEPMPFSEQTPEEREFICHRSIIDHIRQIEVMYLFLEKHCGYCGGLSDDVLARIGVQLGRVGRLRVTG